jgi:hypothetical protein
MLSSRSFVADPHRSRLQAKLGPFRTTKNTMSRDGLGSTRRASPERVRALLACSSAAAKLLDDLCRRLGVCDGQMHILVRHAQRLGRHLGKALDIAGVECRTCEWDYKSTFEE